MATSEPHVQISLSAIAEILQYDLSQPGKETAGLLIGHEQEGIVHIDEVRVGKQKGNAVHVEISDEELTMAAIEVSSRGDGKVIVGWWHTHPGLSAFLSGTDVRTQKLYQALMPNALAIVVDDIKYSQSYDFNDLDFGVFRVENNEQRRIPFGIKDSVNFGLASFLQGDKIILRADQTAQGASGSKHVFVPSLSSAKLSELRLKLSSLEISDEQKKSLEIWLEFSEAIADGAVKEVPIEAENLLEELDNSITTISEDIEDIRDQMINSSATKGLFAIIFGLLAEIAFMYLLLQ